VPSLPHRPLLAWVGVAVAGLAAGVLLWDTVPQGQPNEALVGDPQVGRALIAESGCVACHRVPGLRAADGDVGPDLEGFARQPLVGGVLPLSQDTLIAWLLDPPSIAPRTDMPDLGLSREQAAHIAAYLLTLD
jgi:mono/diheme cytochrome c family protein